jgi:hypothetical protein
MKHSMKRRDFLRTVAKTGLLVPFTNGLLTNLGHAAITAGQGRIIFLTYPNGTGIDRPSTSRVKQWHSPTSAGAKSGIFDLPESCALAPLTPHKTDLTLLRNLHLRHDGTGFHAQIASRLLTGGIPEESISIDRWMTNAFNGVNVMPAGHMNVGVFSNMQTDLHNLTRDEVGQPVAAEQNPHAFYQRLKEAAELANSPDTEKDLALLESIDEDIAELSALSLNQGDQHKLDIHARELELYRQRLQNVIGGCSALPVPHNYTQDELADFTMAPQMAKEQIDLIVAAMSCNLSRVATLSLGTSEGDFPLSWIDYDDQVAAKTSASRPPQSDAWYSHSVSHYTFDAGPLYQQNRWYVEQAAYLIQKLKDANLLDDTIVVMCSEYSDGRHSGCDEAFTCEMSADAGYFLAGGRNMLQAGQILDCQGANHGTLWRDLANILGFPLSDFGISTAESIPGLSV